MKLITLNIWGGRVRQPFLDFIKSNQDIDIFCFQELYHQATSDLIEHYGPIGPNIFTELQTLLPRHQAFFRPVLRGMYGIGIFVKKEIVVLEEGETSIFDAPNYSGIGGAHARNMQWIKCTVRGTEHTIINVHGLWNGRGKTDTKDRIEQSKRIKQFLAATTGPKILCGDFNLRPDTESVALLSDGMINLVEKYGVTSTRTSLYGKEERFADYIFVSPEVHVADFKVLPDEVSDHSPLLLEFSNLKND